MHSNRQPHRDLQRGPYRDPYLALRESIWGDFEGNPMPDDDGPLGADPPTPTPAPGDPIAGALRAQVQALQHAAAACSEGDDHVRFYRLALDAEHLATAHGLEPELAHLNLQIGQGLAAAGLPERALPRLHAASKMFRVLGGQAPTLQALQALADCHGARGQHESMLVYLGEALQTFRPEDAPDSDPPFYAGLVDGHVRHAEFLMAEGQRFEAVGECDRALGLLPRHCRVDLADAPAEGDARLLDALARLHLMQERHALGARCATALVRSGRAEGMSRRFATGCQRAADIRLAQGRHAKAVCWLRRARGCWEAMAVEDEQVGVLERLSDAYAASGRHVEALDAFKAARRIDARLQSTRAALCSELTAIDLKADHCGADPEVLEHACRLAGLGRMVANITHEVTQPLSAIRLIAESAENAMPDETRRVFADAASAPAGFARIVELVDQLSAYVEHLKRFARREPADVRPTALSQIVDEALAICEPMRKNCHARLVLDIDDAVVLADSKSSVAVMVNLLCNAFDAVTGKRRPEVRLTAHRVEDRGVLKVRDLGDGMSVQTLACLYRPFYTTKPSGKGSGLGLALAMDMAQQMDARLDGANHPEGGAQFTLDLALAPMPRVPPAPAPGFATAAGPALSAVRSAGDALTFYAHSEWRSPRWQPRS